MAHTRRDREVFFILKEKRILKIVLAGLFASLSVVIGIICKNHFTFDIYYRVTFENLPIILSGIILGPLYGGAIGAVSDIISCVASTNPAVNPVITVGAASVGITAGVMAKFIIKKHSVIQYIICTFSAHIIGQVIIKSVAKILFMGMPPAGALIGLGISMGVATVEVCIITILMRLQPVRDLEARLK